MAGLAVSPLAFEIPAGQPPAYEAARMPASGPYADTGHAA